MIDQRRPDAGQRLTWTPPTPRSGSYLVRITKLPPGLYLIGQDYLTEKLTGIYPSRLAACGRLAKRRTGMVLRERSA